MVRPMSRKDIFYSGSVTNLKEYQSQKSLTDYRNSVVSLTRFEKEHRHDPPQYHHQEVEATDPCPCLNLPPAFKAALSSMLDVSLLRDPAFMLIGISNLFGKFSAIFMSEIGKLLYLYRLLTLAGMAALYIPFFYLIAAAEKNVSAKFNLSQLISELTCCSLLLIVKGIDKAQAPLLLSVIGITNTFARILCGYVADFPSVDSLFLNNICLVVCTISVGITPLCSSFTSYIIMAFFFGLAIGM
jgi:hypothetical protein